MWTKLKGFWWQLPQGPYFPYHWAPMLALCLDWSTAALPTPQKVLSNWKLFKLKILDFSYRKRTGISILTPTADIYEDLLPEIITNLRQEFWKIVITLFSVLSQHWPFGWNSEINRLGMTLLSAPTTVMRWIFQMSRKLANKPLKLVTGWCKDWNTSSHTITEVKHLELNQFSSS